MDRFTECRDHPVAEARIVEALFLTPDSPVPGAGFEPACLSAEVFETSVSAIPPPGPFRESVASV